MASVLGGRPMRSARILAQSVDDATVLLSLDEGTYFRLNEVGGVVWELCDGGHTVQDVVDAICDLYDAPEDEVRRDVLDLLHELASERLVVDSP